MAVAGSDLRVALNGMSACQAAFTSKKAIKYLGIAWHGMAWHVGNTYRPVAIIIII
jgi:hypothetical protein